MLKRKKFKVILSLIMAVILFVSITACGNQGSDSQGTAADTQKAEASKTDVAKDSGGDSAKTFKIGVVLRDFKAPFQASLKKGLETAAKAYSNIEWDIRDGANDVSTQTNVIETFITQKKDLIIAVPAQLDALVPVVKKCNDANIPVMTINNQLGEGAEVLTYVGVDDYQGGRMQGELAKKMLGEKGNLVLLQGVLGSAAQVDREKGLEDYLKENAPGIKVVAKQNNDWDNAKTITVMQNFLTRFPKGQIDGVIVQGPFDAIAASDACKSAGRTELVGKVIGYDYPKEVLEAINNGTLYGTVNQDPAVQGSLAVNTAADFLNGKIKKEDLDKNTFTDLPAVTKENTATIKPSW